MTTTRPWTLLGLVAIAAAAGAAIGFAGSPAFAAQGYATPGQIGLPAPATEVAREINQFYDFVNIIIIAITLFVLGAA